MRTILYVAFAASGVSGLLYELAWTRYLALFVGHAAYAQILVIAVFLGGLGVGSLLAGQVSKRLRSPIFWYAAAEVLLAVAGLAFHSIFVFVTDAAYDDLLALAGSAGVASTLQWTLAVVLILPQSVILGTTFPLMAAGVLRMDPRAVGSTVATLYFVNTLGGAAGVLLGGFVLIAWAGLPAVLTGAAVLNALAATLALTAWRRAAPSAEPASDVLTRAAAAERPWSTPAPSALQPLWALLLGVSFFTALSSFVYEVGWIRMLSLLMGSATHSFEIMLSAFILGIALGSLLIRRAASRATRPLRLLGWVQWAMGITALATLPVYQELFELMGTLVRTLSDMENGYALFAVSRYAVALTVMLPSTICAGMTLPLITATLLHAGLGERAIGWVYGVNTLGSVTGVVLAGLVLLPAVGLEGMLVAGAALDIALGVGLLVAAVRPEGVRRRTGPLALAVAGAAVVLTMFTVRLSDHVLTSGVFRYGVVPPAADREMLFYADGRTATVGVHRNVASELTVLSTNGKPDASVGDRWMLASRMSLPPEPIVWQDESTQVLAALAALAHVPGARSAAMIGHGSGVTGHYLLAKPDLERLVTIEIEPEMIQGSLHYYPANRRVFDDPRSVIVIDDAKAYFSRQRDRYDLILSEPSNPWVSGVAGLFTAEFYARVRGYLTEGGVFGQWLQLYEITDDAVLSVLAALESAFDHYRAFLVGDSDLLIVASSQPLPTPDWSVVAYPDLTTDLGHVPALTPPFLNAVRMFDGTTVAPLVAAWPHPNSDYVPRLDLEAERSRFLESFARGVFGLGTDRFDVVAAFEGRRAEPRPYTQVPVWGIPQMRARALGDWLRDGGWQEQRWDDAPAEEYRTAGRRYASLRELMAGDSGPRTWDGFLRAFLRVDADLHSATPGSPDTTLYSLARDYLGRHEAPDTVRAAVEFMFGLSAWDFETAARSAELLEELALGGFRGIGPETLLDGAVTSYLALGRIERARQAFTDLLPLTDRGPGDFRARLLDRLILAGVRPRAGGSVTRAAGS